MTTITSRTDVVELVNRRVERGVQHLNDHYGNDSWKAELDTSQLRLQDTCNCVLGQLGGYNVMLDTIDLADGDAAVIHGFDFDQIDDDGDELTVAIDFSNDDETRWLDDHDKFSQMYWEELNRAWLARL